MEELLVQVAGAVARTIEFLMIAIVAVGTIKAFIALARRLFSGEAVAPHVRKIWLHYAAWILLALEFALAADLIETIVAPSWQEIGQLGAIAGIRIALGYFLGRDISEYSEETEASGKVESQA
jgi:uncharacterized membrane protein